MLLEEFNMKEFLEMDRRDEHAAGVAEGHAAGLAEGHATGKREAQATVIQNMLLRGFSNEEICELTGCPQTLVLEIRSAARLTKDNTPSA